MTDADKQDADKHTWKKRHTAAVFAILVGIVAAGILIPADSGVFAWLAILGLLAVFTVAVGHGVTGRLRGCLIDSRNRMSLARLQTILWTILVLSAFLAAALIRVRAGVADPLAIGVPEQLLIVMGISTTSLVGSPLIIGAKKDKTPRGKEEEKTVDKLVAQGEGATGKGATGKGFDVVGQIITKSEPLQASVSDLFKGDETSDAAQLDLGKIQMFYFTIALVLAYGAQLGGLFLVGQTQSLASLPELSTSMAALLGISHAGYLANKATPS